MYTGSSRGQTTMTRNSGTEGGSTTIGAPPADADDPVLRGLLEGLSVDDGTLEVTMEEQSDDPAADTGSDAPGQAGRLASAAAETPTDGRLLRSQRTKRAIV